MGYDLHITRKAIWFDEEGPTIGCDEWLRLIETDPELSLDQETRCSFGDEEVVFAAWNGQPGVLGWFDGEVSSTYPDRSLILKMVQVAEQLGAKVQGDDGEEYPEALERYFAGEPAPWWQRFLTRP